MTKDELDGAIDAMADPGAILLTEADWESIIRPEPPEVQRTAQPLRPWTYRQLNVWVTTEPRSQVVTAAEARRRRLS